MERNDSRSGQVKRARKVLILATVSATIDAFLIPHAEALVSRGWRVAFAAGTPATSRMTASGVDFHLVSLTRNPNRLSVLVRGLSQIRALLIAERFDVVYVHTPIAAALLRLAAASIRSADRPSVVYFAHGFHFLAPHERDMSQRFWLAIEWLLSRWTALLIVINKTDAASVASWRITRQGRVRYFQGIGIEPESYVRSAAKNNLEIGPEYSSVERWICCVAEFSVNKRHFLLVEALRKLPPSVGLLLAGSGETMDKVQDQARRLGLQNRIAFLGQVPDIRPVIACASVAALVSRREGLPRSLMEALCMGVPVAVTPTRGSEDVARAAGCPIASSDAVEDIVHALSTALSDTREPNEIRESFLGAWQGGTQKAVLEKLAQCLTEATMHRPT